jgi:hypothetical protein
VQYFSDCTGCTELLWLHNDDADHKDTPPTTTTATVAAAAAGRR